MSLLFKVLLILTLQLTALLSKLRQMHWFLRLTVSQLQTTYNSRNLLDGSLSGIKFQVGAFSNETVGLTIANNRAYSLGAVYTHTTSTVTTDALADGTDYS